MTVITSLNISATWYPNVGDVDENSQFWASSQGNQWLQLDLKPGSPTWGRTVNNGSGLPPHIMLDWAYVPGTGNYLYGLSYDVKNTTLPDADNHVYLQRFERTTKTWSVVANLERERADLEIQRPAEWNHHELDPFFNIHGLWSDIKFKRRGEMCQGQEYLKAKIP
ncbi:hypothetical protein BJ166DRAFT_497404 [Pestalotiopsis sp. NC0098]|nr:hypothetical protein BJ166DRAFT_497404 [Pestalotiopsis sp. NC0098]